MNLARRVGLRGLPLMAVGLWLTLSMTEPASAYVGPGAGLTLIGSVVAVAAAALLALVGLVLFPIRLAMKKARQAKADREQAAMPDIDPT
jgi:hypothetical protein